MENRKPDLPEDDDLMPMSVYHLPEMTPELERKVEELRARMMSLSKEERRKWLGWPERKSEKEDK